MDDDYKEHQFHQIGEQAGHDHDRVHQSFKLYYFCLLLFEVAVEHHIGGVHRDHMLGDVPNSETERKGKGRPFQTTYESLDSDAKQKTVAFDIHDP